MITSTHTYADLPIPSAALEAVKKALATAGPEYLERYTEGEGLHWGGEIRLIALPLDSRVPAPKGWKYHHGTVDMAGFWKGPDGHIVYCSEQDGPARIAEHIRKNG